MGLRQNLPIRYRLHSSPHLRPWRTGLIITWYILELLYFTLAVFKDPSQQFYNNAALSFSLLGEEAYLFAFVQARPLRNTLEPYSPPSVCTPPPNPTSVHPPPSTPPQGKVNRDGLCLADTLQHKDNTVSLQLHLTVLLSHSTVIVSYTVSMNTVPPHCLNLLLNAE